MPLLDLPPQPLAHIAHGIGASKLRESVARLPVPKRWYRAVLPVYLSQLPHFIFYLASDHDLERLPPPDTPLSNLIRAKTKRLSVRLCCPPI